MKQRRSFDLSVYFIADPSVCGGRRVEHVVRAAVDGGATMVQLRDKSGDLAQVERHARAIQEALYNSDVAFIINDYVDLAARIGADGAHIGQDDMGAVRAREILGEAAILGQTAFTPEHLAAVDAQVIDYVGTGPVYPTLTKPGKPVLGVEGFGALVSLSPVPVVGIGGMTPETCAFVMQAGAKGVAMMRGISEAEDPRSAARRFMAEVRRV